MVRGARLFSTHRHPNRSAVVVTGGRLPATFGASGKVCAVGQSGAVGVFLSHDCSVGAAVSFVFNNDFVEV